MVDSPPYIKIASAPGLRSPKHLSPHMALDRGASRRQMERIASLKKTKTTLTIRTFLPCTPLGSESANRDSETTRDSTEHHACGSRTQINPSTPLSEARDMPFDRLKAPSEIEGLRVDTERRSEPRFKNRGLPSTRAQAEGAPSNVPTEKSIKKRERSEMGQKKTGSSKPDMEEWIGVTPILISN